MTPVVSSQTQKDARNRRLAADTSSIKAALQRYFDDNGEYPDACVANGVAAVTACTHTYLSSYLAPKYLATLPTASGKLDYLRSTASTSGYSLRVKFEARSLCQTGRNVDTTWYSGIALCEF